MAEAPTELLVDIFDMIHQAELFSDTRSSIITPLALSHVCRHWREVILDLPHHWTHVHLSHTRHTSISKDIFRRSKPCPLVLALSLADTTAFAQSLPESKDFIATVTDRSVIERLRDLRIVGHNLTISRVAAGFNHFPTLETLVVRQTQPVEDHYFIGPFSFDPTVFKALTLEGIGLHCSRSAALSGVTTLTLVRAAESILNQTTLLDYSHPSTPFTPCMTRLSQLRLIGTPPPAIRQRISPELYSPSFDRSNLTFVHLANFQSDFPTHIVRSLLNPSSLEELELENIRELALLCLVGLISDIANTLPLPFAQVHTLTLVDTSDFSHLLANQMLRCVPQLRTLRLRHVDIGNFAAALRDPWICPLVSSILVDGVEMPRPSAIMMIASPA